jgi:hypothetical protein
MFVNPSRKNRLNNTARPSIFNVKNPPPKLGRKRRILERNEDLLPSKGKEVAYDLCRKEDLLFVLKKRILINTSCVIDSSYVHSVSMNSE